MRGEPEAVALPPKKKSRFNDPGAREDTEGTCAVIDLVAPMGEAMAPAGAEAGP